MSAREVKHEKHLVFVNFSDGKRSIINCKHVRCVVVNSAHVLVYYNSTGETLTAQTTEHARKIEAVFNEALLEA